MPNPAGQIVVIVDIRAKSGREEEVRKGLEAAVAATRLKDGCLLFRLQEDVAARGHLVLYELWESVAALDTHHASAQFAALLEAAGPMVDSADLCKFKVIAD